MPIVIVANKTDKERELDAIETETVVLMDWENGYVESSAMLNKNISQIFKELLHQARSELRLLSGLPAEGLLALSSGNVNMMVHYLIVQSIVHSTSMCSHITH